MYVCVCLWEWKSEWVSMLCELILQHTYLIWKWKINSFLNTKMRTISDIRARVHTHTSTQSPTYSHRQALVTRGHSKFNIWYINTNWPLSPSNRSFPIASRNVKITSTSQIIHVIVHICFFSWFFAAVIMLLQEHPFQFAEKLIDCWGHVLTESHILIHTREPISSHRWKKIRKQK